MGKPINVLIESIYALVLAGLVLIIIILQCLAIWFHWHKKTSPLERNAILILTLVFLIYFCNFSNLILAIGLSTALPTHNICHWGYKCTQVIYGSTRVLSLLFLLQRARLAHTMTPLFTEKYFTKIFPAMVFLLWIILGGSLFATPGRPGHMVTNSSHGLTSYHCVADKHSQSRLIYLIAALVITVVVTFFIYLFLYPICKLMRNTNSALASSSSSSSSSSNRHINSKEPLCDAIAVNQKQFKTLLMWSLLLSSISLSASLMTMIVWPLYETRLFFIPHADYIIDSICTFLLLGRNRSFLSEICCGCCTKSKRHEPDFSLRTRKRSEIPSNRSSTYDTSVLVANWRAEQDSSIRVPILPEGRILE